ncbi:hypothetical protein [Bifidobacterium moukalabense]|uniref:hypothetical protein n=1 Tax=Bifidobacterium moukalabense TaxID=1333651 RepID=UPI0010F6E95A|nr:hypothetical protein [Bifidobacterium moukalabense]
MTSRRRQARNVMLHEERRAETPHRRSAKERWLEMASCRRCGAVMDDYSMRSMTGHPVLCFNCIQAGYREKDYR